MILPEYVHNGASLIMGLNVLRMGAVFLRVSHLIIDITEEFLTVLAINRGLLLAEVASGIFLRHIRLLEFNLGLDHMRHGHVFSAAYCVIHLEASPLVRLGAFEVHTVVVVLERDVFEASIWLVPVNVRLANVDLEDEDVEVRLFANEVSVALVQERPKRELLRLIPRDVQAAFLAEQLVDVVAVVLARRHQFHALDLNRLLGAVALHWHILVDVEDDHVSKRTVDQSEIHFEGVL